MNHEIGPNKRESNTVPWEKAHLFISSTFNDMHAERDFLVKKVFPRLAEWCEQRKLRMVDIDLRWGVTEEDATRNKNVVEVCLRRIDECRPFFLCFLGQRYGWVPKREDLSEATLGDFPGVGEAVDGKYSVTEMEILHAVMRPFHPESRIQQEDLHPAQHAFFFLREGSYLDHLPHEPVYRKRIYTDEVEEKPETRKFLLRKNQILREETVPQTGQPVILYEAEWLDNASSPELALPLACPALLDENIVRWRRLWHEAAGLKVDGRVLTTEQAEEARTFNEQLTRGRLTEFKKDGRPLEEVILHSLQKALKQRFPEHAKVEAETRTELQRELDQQDQFLFICGEGFIKRHEDFDELDAYVDGNSNHLFVLTALGGIGKSTLLANWIGRRQARLNCDAKETLHYRFIGQSDGSTTVDSLLRLLLQELQETVGKLDEEIPANPQELRQKWLKLLEAVGKNGKTILVFDAVNQLETGLSDLQWLLRKLPAGIKIIASFKRGEEAAERLFAELMREDNVQLSEVKPFANEHDRKMLVKAYLQQYFKELDERHMEELIRSKGAENPLFLKVVLSELRVFGAFASLGEKIRQDFGTDPVSAFNAVLARLERDPAYSAIPPGEAVPLLFGLLAHARRGLSVEELTDLFVQVLDLKTTEEAGKAAADTVHLFLRQVRPFLARRDGRYDFFYESFQIATRKRLVGSATAEAPSRRPVTEWHGLLAEHFYSIADPAGDYTWRAQGRRGLSELPFHLVGSEQWSQVEATLCDLNFIESKCAVQMVPELFGDYSLALERLPELQDQRSAERKRAQRLRKFSADLVQYAMGEIPSLKVPRSLEIAYSEADAPQAQSGGIERHERLEAFMHFVGSNAEALSALGVRPGFCRQHAYNSAGSGPVGDAADSAVGSIVETQVLLAPSQRPRYVPQPALLRTIEADQTRVSSLRITADGRQAVSAGFDGQLKIWDLDTAACLRSLDAHELEATAVALTPDGSLAVSGGGDTKVRVWDLRSGECIQVLEGHSWPITCLSVTPDGSMAVAGDKTSTLQVWDLGTSECLAELKGQTPSGERALVISPDGMKVVSNWGNRFFVWDVGTVDCLPGPEDLARANIQAMIRDGTPLKGGFAGLYAPREPEHADSLLSLSVTPTGRRAVTGAEGLAEEDDTLRVWNLESGKCTRVLHGQPEPAVCVALTADGKLAVSAGGTQLRLWDLRTGSCVKVLEGHSSLIKTLDMTPDGRRAVSADDRGTILVWDPVQGQGEHRFETHRRPGKTQTVLYCRTAVSVTPDRRGVLSGGEDGRIRLWDLESGKCLKALQGDDEPVLSIQAANDLDHSPISGSKGGRVRIWDPAIDQCTRVIETGAREIRDLEIVPDGRRMVVAGGDKLQVWEPSNGEILAELSGHSGSLKTIRLAPDGRTLASAPYSRYDKKQTAIHVRVWDVESGACLATLPHQDRYKLRDGVSRLAGIQALEWTLDGQRLLCASGKQVAIWDAEKGLALGSLSGHRGTVHCVQVTPDGKQVVTGSADGALRIWDLESYECEATLEERRIGIQCLRLSPDGSTVVSGGSDGTLSLWDLRTRELLALHQERNKIESIDHFSPAGRVVLTTLDGEVRILHLVNLSLAEPVLTARRTWQYGDRGAPGHWTDILTADCRHCGKTFPLPSELAMVLTDATNDPTDAGELSHACPNCGGALRFNPFVVDPCGPVAVTDGESIGSVITIETTIRAHEDRITDCAFSADGTRVVSASRDRTLRLWDARSGEERGVLTGHKSGVSGCAVAEDHLVLSASLGELKFWNEATQEEIGSLTGPIGLSVACALSCDGMLMITGGDDLLVGIWEMGEWELRHGHLAPITSCSISPDSAFAVSASADKTLRVWDVASKETRHVLEGHTAGVTCCAVAPDSRWVLSGSKDQTLRLWSADSGEVESVLRGHEGELAGCAITPDGRLAASVSQDRTVRLWEVGVGRELARLDLPQIPDCVAVHPLRPVAVVGDHGGTLHQIGLKNVDWGPIVVTAVESSPRPTFRCPACRKLWRFPETWLGRDITCPEAECKQRIRISAAARTPALP
jgi:WD40 repeat protein